MRNKSIKQKLIVNSALIIFIGGLFTAIAISYNSYTQVISHEQEKAILDTSKKAEVVSSFFSTTGSYMETVSENPEIVQWLIEENYVINDEINSILEITNIRNKFEAVYIQEIFGEVVASSNENLIGSNFNHHPYFKRAIIGYTGLSVMLHDSGGKYYHLSKPIRNSNNQIIGAVTAVIQATTVRGLLDHESSGDKEDYLVDENAIIICAEDRDDVFKPLAPLDDLTRLRIANEERYPVNNEGSFNYQIIQQLIRSNTNETSNIEDGIGANTLFTISPVNNSPFYIVSKTDLVALRNSSLVTGSLLFIPTILTSVAIIIFIFFLIRGLLKPLESLKDTTKTIGLGNFDPEKKVHTGDEIEDLENAILSTAQKLKDAYTRIEDKVKERTEEIEKKNMQAEKTNKAILNIMEDIDKERDKVTNLAKDLRKFKQALDNTTEQVLIAEPDGTIIYANHGLEKITGYKIEEVIGKKSKDLYRIIEDEEKEKKMFKDLVEKKMSYTGEFKNRRKNGEEYTTLTTVSPVLGEDGNVEFLASLSYDISREKQIDRAKTEFVSLASHQLRTPLSSVNWYAEMLLAEDAGKLNEEQRTFIKEMYKGNQRMVDLVNSLLDVSRLELGTFSINPEQIDITHTAKSVIDELKPGITKKKLKLKANFEEALPETKADPKLLRIIYQNLLSNAVKYTPDGGQVGVDISKDKKHFIIKISDTGYGIPENQKDKMFSKLFRADNVKEKDTEGTGLGLYIIKSILDVTGGQISFESELDKGTTFVVKIPLDGMKKKEGEKNLGD